jgi:hypothetical protein
MTRLALLVVVCTALGCTARPLSGHDGGVAGQAPAGAAFGGDGGAGSPGGGAAGMATTSPGSGGSAGLPVDAATPGADAAPSEPVQVPRIACDVSCPGGPCAVRAGSPIVIASGRPTIA